MKTREEVNAAFSRAYSILGEAATRERVEGYRLMKTARYIERYCEGYEGKRVLELGSSLGVHLLGAKELGATQVVGLDYFIFPDAGENDFYVSSEELQSLGKVWRTEDLLVIRHHLGEVLPFPDNRFDLVVCNAVIEHLHDIHRHVFHEAHRVLAPGGHFVFTTPNLASALKRTRFIVGRSPNWNIKDFVAQGKNFTGHVREFTLSECKYMLTEAGFTEVRVQAKPGYFKWRWLRMPKKWHTFIFQLIARPFRSLGDLIYASGRKA